MLTAASLCSTVNMCFLASTIVSSMVYINWINATGGPIFPHIFSWVQCEQVGAQEFYLSHLSNMWVNQISSDHFVWGASTSWICSDQSNNDDANMAPTWRHLIPSPWPSCQSWHPPRLSVCCFSWFLPLASLLCSGPCHTMHWLSSDHPLCLLPTCVCLLCPCPCFSLSATWPFIFFKLVYVLHAQTPHGWCNAIIQMGSKLQGSIEHNKKSFWAR